MSFFSNEVFSRIDHIFGHNSSLSKLEKIAVISSIFSATVYDIRNQLQEKKLKNTNTEKLNSILLNKKKITEEIKEKVSRNKDNKIMT